MMKSFNFDTSVYDSAKRGQPALFELHEVFKYRNLISQLVRRDILTRYKRSVLGITWTLLNPLGMMIVLTIAFSQIFKISDVYSYSAYVLSGLLAWNLFSQTTTAAMVNLVWGGGLLNRIYIPRSSFAIAAIGTGLINTALALIPLILVMLVTKVPIRVTIIFLPVSAVLLACFSLGIGLFISTLSVYFPDVAEMYQIILNAWMYLTPIIYPVDILPEAYRYWITNLNPMFHMVRLFRIPIYYGRLPFWNELWPVLLISTVTLVLGWILFSEKSDEFAYRI